MGESCSCLRSEENPQKEIRTSEDNAIITLKEQPQLTLTANDAGETLPTHEEPANQSGSGLIAVTKDFLTRKVAQVTELVQTPREPAGTSANDELDYVSESVVQQYLSSATINRLRTELGELKLEPAEEQELQQRGPVRIDDGLLYIGEWNETGHPHGRGTLILQDTYFFQGYLQLNNKSGFGRIIFSTGEVYEGEFKHDQIHGTGVFTLSDGSRIEGQFKDGEVAEGTQTAANGTVYTGQFRNGAWHGKGTLKLKNGNVYEGEFRKGTFHGRGTLTHANGNSYTGDWANDRMHGRGVFTWVDGRKYEGQYNNDERHGTGSYWETDGTVFTGQWAHGKKHGKGRIEVVRHGKRRIKEGEWKDGVPL